MDRPTRDMSDRHEAHLVNVLGGRLTKASGSSNDKGDGVHVKGEETYCFAWDGKSTRAASMSVKVGDFDKIVEQRPGYRPMIPIRFYRDDRLTAMLDLAILDLNDVAELIEMANEWAKIKETGCTSGTHHMVRPFHPDGTLVRGTFPRCTACGLYSYEASEPNPDL